MRSDAGGKGLLAVRACWTANLLAAPMDSVHSTGSIGQYTQLSQQWTFNDEVRSMVFIQRRPLNNMAKDCQ